MMDAFHAVMSAVLLVLLSLIGGGILYVVAKDFVKRSLRKKD